MQLENKKSFVILFILITISITAVLISVYLTYSLEIKQKEIVVLRDKIEQVAEVKKPKEELPVTEVKPLEFKLLSKVKVGDLEVGVFEFPKELPFFSNIILLTVMSGSSPSYNGEYVLIETLKAFSSRPISAAGNEVYAINGFTNTVDVYSPKVVKFRNIDMSPFAALNFVKRIELPKLKLGKLHDIVCNNITCELKSIASQESGCELSLDLKSQIITLIRCTMNGNEYSPEPIE